MFFKKIFWNLFLPVMTLLAAVALALSWYSVNETRQLYLDQTQEHLHRLATIWEPQAVSLFLDASGDERMTACQRLKALTRCRITLIAANGVVLADTDEDPEAMDNHGRRPEIIEASEKGTGSAIRYSHTLRQPMIYHALRLAPHGDTLGFLRLAQPMADIERTVARMQWNTSRVAALVLLLAAAVAVFLARQITGPLKRMTEAAEALAAGDFDRRVPYSLVDEVHRLADAFNRMVVRLQLAVKNNERQTTQLIAVLDSMAEGVMAVDREQRVMSINNAAAALLGTTCEKGVGRLLGELVCNPDILDTIEETFQQCGPIRKETTLISGHDTPLHVEVRADPVLDEHQRVSGVVIVLHDITRLWQLERIRRDFVANVSHELKTPITSIKGSVETLLDGAMNDPEARMKFLEIIRRHADRLNAIITDLLTLSRMEQEGEARQIARQPTPIRALLEETAQICRHRAAEKNITLELACPSDLSAAVAPELLEQAIINLLDNAIKFSDPGQLVRLSGRVVDGNVEIQVQDHGCGIPKEHQTRIFERFYRVDKARSRALGGTGLGLAIVKHIVQLHHGTVSVDSEVGHGSTFTIRIPTTAPTSEK